MAIESFRDLRVWQGGMDLVEKVYAMTARFPKGEIFGLSSQIQRAAVSIPSNIAEGHTRAHTKEYLNHLSIAQASLAELETQIEIALRLQYIDKGTAAETLSLAFSLGKQLYALRNAIMRSSGSAT
jgi:four helix bundle protein